MLLLKLFEGDNSLVLGSIISLVIFFITLGFGRFMHRISDAGRYLHWIKFIKQPIMVGGFIFSISIFLESIISWFSNDLYISLYGYFQCGKTIILILVFNSILMIMIRHVSEKVIDKNKNIQGFSNYVSTVHIISNGLRLFVVFITVVSVVMVFGGSISQFLAFGGIGGVVVGFAAKDFCANFFGAISITLNHPFTVGDRVLIGGTDIHGFIDKINLRETIIIALDGHPIHVPNSIFISACVENRSRAIRRRIKEILKVYYADPDSISLIIDEVRDMLKLHDSVAKSSFIFTSLCNIGDSIFEFEIYAYVNGPDTTFYRNVRQDVLISVLKIIKKHGCRMLLPNTEVFTAETSNPVNHKEINPY